MFGLFKRKKTSDAKADATPHVIAPPIEFGGEVMVAGTTTFAREAVEALATRYAMAPRDTIEVPATISPEPDNLVDPDAVAVFVDGEKVGALPGYLAHSLNLPVGMSHPVMYQLNALREDGKRIKAKAFVWLSPTPPVWTYSRSNPAPLLTSEQAAENQARAQEIAARNLGPDTPIGRALRSGNMRGFTPIELIEPIKQLKREKRWEDALTLLYAAIEGEENGARVDGRTPAPWFTEHAAICHRKLKEHEEEVAVLKRYLEYVTPEYRANNKIQERLSKMEERG